MACMSKYVQEQGDKKAMHGKVGKFRLVYLINAFLYTVRNTIHNYLWMEIVPHSVFIFCWLGNFSMYTRQTTFK
jgi:hypothetical protein